jgi:hypothetical protein
LRHPASAECLRKNISVLLVGFGNVPSIGVRYPQLVNEHRYTSMLMAEEAKLERITTLHCLLPSKIWMLCFTTS